MAPHLVEKSGFHFLIMISKYFFDRKKLTPMPGTAGNCNLVGDFLKDLNNQIDFKCIADAAGWIPLPVYNSDSCDNGMRLTL